MHSPFSFFEPSFRRFPIALRGNYTSYNGNYLGDGYDNPNKRINLSLSVQIVKLLVQYVIAYINSYIKR